MAKEDILLTFDLNSFRQGIQKASQAVNGFVGNTTKTVNKIVSKIPIIGKRFKQDSEGVKKTAEGTSKGILKSFGKLALIGGIIAGSIGLIKKAISAIPEIGMTFKAVGNIVTKNLLWPLRQELIPVLQKVLDWARDNRAMFVKWGGVVLNVFKAVKTVFGVVLNLLKTLTKSLMANLKGLVNFVGRDITEIINVLVFKLTALFLILETKLTPVFEFIGKNLAEISVIFGEFFNELKDIGVLETFYKLLQDISSIVGKGIVLGFEALKTSLELVTSLLTGFFSGLGEVEGLSESWDKFLNIITKVLDKVIEVVKVVEDKLGPAFKVLGGIIGTLVGKTLQLFLDTLTGVYDTMEKIVKLAIDKITGASNGSVTAVDDAIIKPNGQVIKTNPQDTIVALKRPEETVNKMQSQNQNINISVPGINVNVTEGNAKQAGINFGMGLEQQMRQIYLDQKTAAGER